MAQSLSEPTEVKGPLQQIIEEEKRLKKSLKDRRQEAITAGYSRRNLLESATRVQAPKQSLARRDSIRSCREARRPSMPDASGSTAVINSLMTPTTACRTRAFQKKPQDQLDPTKSEDTPEEAEEKRQRWEKFMQRREVFLQNKEEFLEAERRKKEDQELEGCTFAPAKPKRIKGCAAGQSVASSGSMADRALQMEIKKQEKIKKIRQELLDKEMEECFFRPEIIGLAPHAYEDPGPAPSPPPCATSSRRSSFSSYASADAGYSNVALKVPHAPSDGGFSNVSARLYPGTHQQRLGKGSQPGHVPLPRRYGSEGQQSSEPSDEGSEFCSRVTSVAPTPAGDFVNWPSSVLPASGGLLDQDAGSRSGATTPRYGAEEEEEETAAEVVEVTVLPQAAGRIETQAPSPPKPASQAKAKAACSASGGANAAIGERAVEQLKVVQRLKQRRELLEETLSPDAHQKALAPDPEPATGGVASFAAAYRRASVVGVSEAIDRMEALLNGDLSELDVASSDGWSPNVEDCLSLGKGFDDPEDEEDDEEVQEACRRLTSAATAEPTLINGGKGPEANNSQARATSPSRGGG